MESNRQPPSPESGQRPPESWVRDGLGPDSGTVDRVVRNALAAGKADSGQPGGRRRRLLAATILIPGILALLLLLPRGRTPAPSAARVTGGRGPLAVTITNASGKVTVIVSEPVTLRRARSARSKGTPSHVVIFNRADVIAAVLPRHHTGHFISGGKP